MIYRLRENMISDWSLVTLVFHKGIFDMLKMLMEPTPSLNLILSLQTMTIIDRFKVHSYSKKSSKLFHNINIWQDNGEENEVRNIILEGKF